MESPGFTITANVIPPEEYHRHERPFIIVRSSTNGITVPRASVSTTRAKADGQLGKRLGGR